MTDYMKQGALFFLCLTVEMMKRNVILLSALFLLIIANVLMMSYSSPAFKPTSEGFAGYIQKLKGVEKFTNYGATAGGAKDSYQSMGQYDGLVLKTGIILLGGAHLRMSL